MKKNTQHITQTPVIDFQNPGSLGHQSRLPESITSAIECSKQKIFKKRSLPSDSPTGLYAVSNHIVSPNTTPKWPWSPQKPPGAKSNKLGYKHQDKV